MGISEAKKKANKKWNDANLVERYDRIQLVTPKGKKEDIKAHAELQDESISGFINRAIDQAMQYDSAAPTPIDTSQDGVLVLRELGYDPVTQKPLYVEETTGKQYFVEQVKEETDVAEPNEDEIPF